VELAALDAAAGLVEAADQQVGVAREIEHQVRVAPDREAAKRRRAIRHRLAAWEQVAQA
jgi:hypothetical protein